MLPQETLEQQNKCPRAEIHLFPEREKRNRKLFLEASKG